MILSVKNASFAYKKGNTVFEDVTFDISSGEIMSILGANGSGKTTLLRCVMGMLKLKKGEVLLDGEKIGSLSQKKLWQKIAYVPQARGVYSSLDVKNMILLGTASRVGVFSSPGEREERLAILTAERLGITHLLDKKCSEVSGGELQMVLIARALAAEPEVMILDEPESNLDFRNQLIVLDTLSTLAKDGLCCIFNTHYPEHALARADKSLLLCRDKALFGRTDEIITEENIRLAFGVEAVIGGLDSHMTVIPTGIIK